MADLPPGAYGADERTRELCMADPDLASMRLALLKAEAVCHRGGWDRPASFGPIESIDPYGYRLPACPDLNFLLNRHGNPAAALMELVKYPGDIAAIIGTPRYTAFRGLYFMSEGWHVVIPKDGAPAQEKYDWAMADDHMLHQHPRRIEARSLYAATTDGAVWNVTRHRGRKPVCLIDRVLEGVGEVDGRIPDALLKLTFDLRTLFWNDFPERELL